ncbi:MAG TPA: hypothetical protein VIK14_11085 [Ignavibacteria bacterium]
MREKIIKNKKISNEKSVIVKPEISKVPFEDLHIEGEKHFKLRAECINDVLLLIEKMRKRDIWAIKIEQCGFLPDVDFEFKTTKTLDEILTILRKQVDSHVMIDTLAPYNEYTGER